MNKLKKLSIPAFTLVELLVVLLIISILMSLLFSSASNARESAGRAKCLANLRTIGMAAATYSSENKLYPAPPGFWQAFHDAGYIATNSQVWICPSDQRTNKKSTGVGPISYAYNGRWSGLPPTYWATAKAALLKIPKPTKTVYFCDANAYYMDQANKTAAFRHKGKINALFYDGHVETLTFTNSNDFYNSL